ncbi:hypothetical protein SARC_02471 [Sphaeroforma arctica JP610]|uniref:EF-hand domain-containing protein n=1 Tax=Sphaeroforma arctica JP610 TaxID=667725 RepID=A0A0L0G8V7_9EUKA|nr:hypothetical protein SARC_02471 [Sphaeroforma arctica JP610]KNC85349.1 hypothetical protein SARC_02471 [Sphaeroforma arctica JP610]|eukprot:XP_014159251.1 hypothetical protein SARC_02471 [Sphaeroforma arctica JP610]
MSSLIPALGIYYQPGIAAMGVVATVSRVPFRKFTNEVIESRGKEHITSLLDGRNVVSHEHEDAVEHKRLMSKIPLRGYGLAKDQQSKWMMGMARNKVVSMDDAVEMVCNGDTIGCTGFVAQGAPEAVLKALGENYVKFGVPNSLTAMFGGGPGDWATKGLNHLAHTADEVQATTDGLQKDMLFRTIGAHYGQTPQIAKLVLNEKVEAWSIPMGSISRMWRSTAAHVPGHLTTTGMGTFVDPVTGSGGKINKRAEASSLKVVSEVFIDKERHLFYKALPISVAIIRATTADSDGNLSFENESLVGDARNLAMAARNSGGIVIAQVKNVAQNGTIPAPNVRVPGILVDCVVKVDRELQSELHPMSYYEDHNPSWSGQLKVPVDAIEPMPLDARKIIARRAATTLKPNKVVNLGIGMPEGVASVAEEEGVLQSITLTTEAGAIGGIPASGYNFGPSTNASAMLEMNSMFDLYSGGGLDACYLGMAQVTPTGDVNVTRLSEDRLTGPGGFIDISQATHRVCFMGTMTTKGLKLGFGDNSGVLNIEREGAIKKFVNDTYEVTFSGDEAVRRGQHTLYVTERAVFKRSSAHPILELIEIAPGLDLERDVLSAMEFRPVISPDLKTMDPRLFKFEKMGLRRDMTGVSLSDRAQYHEDDHTLLLDLSGVTVSQPEELRRFESDLKALFDPLKAAGGKFNAVINYDGFDCWQPIEKDYRKMVEEMEENYYLSSRRFTGNSFRRFKLGKSINVHKWNPEEMFNAFDENKDGEVSREELKSGMRNCFDIRLTHTQIHQLFGAKVAIGRKQFTVVMKDLLDNMGRTEASRTDI